MIFKNIQLSTFRNYDRLNVAFHPQVNVFLGRNGQGKTNLLEAIYFCAKGDSFRPGKNGTYIQKNELNPVPVGVIKSEVSKNSLNYQLKVQLEESKKQFLVNEKKRNTVQMAKMFPTILFSPESLSAIKNGPDERRQLIDQFLISHSDENVRLIREYRRCLRTRNKILRDFRQELTSRKEALALLASINGSFLPLATHLTWARIESIRGILTDLNKAMAYISNQENVDISVDYLISSESAIHLEKDQIFEKHVQRGIELQPGELASGTTLIGPHKHDVQFLFEGEDSRFYCSQGQQRALILSFKMAQIMYHRKVLKEDPVLLLDDVVSELDEEKRRNLFEFLKGIESQIFVTTTDLSLPSDFNREMSVFDIDRGTLKERI